jgi:hypothetical protein
MMYFVSSPACILKNDRDPSAEGKALKRRQKIEAGDAHTAS